MSKVSSVPSSAKMGGTWPSTPEKPGPTGYNAYSTARSGTQTWWATICGPTFWSNWVIKKPFWSLTRTSFRKRGKKSAGVKQQYCGTTGRVENCQVGVFLSYVSSKGHTLIDRELYLPKEWIDDLGRRREAGIPEAIVFRTKCELAQQMIERLWKAKIPFDWVVADSVYGGNLDLRLWLEAHGYSYVLTVACDEPVGIRTPEGRKRMTVAEAEALLLHSQDWH